jgi:hypothetical protein
LGGLTRPRSDGVDSGRGLARGGAAFVLQAGVRAGVALAWAVTGIPVRALMLLGYAVFDVSDALADATLMLVVLAAPQSAAASAASDRRGIGDGAVRPCEHVFE